MSVKSSISISDEQHVFVRNLVAQGRYSSVSAVIQNGIDLIRQKTEADEAETVALRMLLEARRKGPFISGDELKTRLSAKIAAKRHED